ncbi:sugar phosphate nucleotidyltransferase [Desulfospira joergensenii]|uniref:sugar phosphate nucleotidyltransferase n=1 Tax=Desulfospira joergensenii TaxID=53329 RepID=UPI0003B5FB98|nr:sugar phosphate nucleotidyltransferase [Desulfospira joergensenii]
MKALILAAGFGTRLLPHTQERPKPLFTLGNRPLLEIAINGLVEAGCEHILINTHHLHEKIQSFVRSLRVPVKIQLVHEKEILETGGAIANIRSFVEDGPFFVINSDVVSSLDLKALYEFHSASGVLATLAVHDHKEFNIVKIDSRGFIENFEFPEKGLAFTGIQVLSPAIFDRFPDQKKFSSIDLYRTLCPEHQVKAYVAQNLFWRDIGTPFSYTETSMRWTAGQALDLPVTDLGPIEITPLAGDGSDRKWFRASSPREPARTRSVVISDHGICSRAGDNLAQIRSFVRIGGHLFSKGIPVPEILAFDELSGIVVLEDLGHAHLADRIKTLDRSGILSLYKRVIQRIIEFSQKGKIGFDPAWTCQTETYSRDLILEKECRYFMEAFVQGYMGIEIDFNDYIEEFNYIADMALKHSTPGLMHRDMQSRNIMIHKEKIFFIDYQSARTGPLEYDLASLLIDPYVTLARNAQEDLLAYAIEILGIKDKIKTENFLRTFGFCCLTRNLQILGAFGYLSRVKGKTGFQAHIPPALDSLKSIFLKLDQGKLKNLTDLVRQL